MNDFPKTDKGLKQRISSYRRSLAREKQAHDFISDGYGKRYLLFVLYFLLGDRKKTQEYFGWYEKEFPDDSGDPIQLLCWAILLFRMGEEDKAIYKLAEAMLSNLYILPFLQGRKIKKYDMWHSSNDGEISYLDYLPEQVVNDISKSELDWMAKHYDSFVFQRIRDRYLEIFHELESLKEIDARKVLVREAGSLLDLLQ